MKNKRRIILTYIAALIVFIALAITLIFRANAINNTNKATNPNSISGTENGQGDQDVLPSTTPEVPAPQDVLETGNNDSDADDSAVSFVIRAYDISNNNQDLTANRLTVINQNDKVEFDFDSSLKFVSIDNQTFETISNVVDSDLTNIIYQFDSVGEYSFNFIDKDSLVRGYAVKVSETETEEVEVEEPSIPAESTEPTIPSEPTEIVEPSVPAEPIIPSEPVVTIVDQPAPTAPLHPVAHVLIEQASISIFPAFENKNPLFVTPLHSLEYTSAWTQVSEIPSDSVYAKWSANGYDYIKVVHHSSFTYLYGYFPLDTYSVVRISLVY